MAAIPIFQALAHDDRLRILNAIDAAGEASPRDLALKLNDDGAGKYGNLENLSYHVRVLARAELINLKRRRMVRGAVQHFYQVTDRGRLALELAARAGEL